VGYPVQNGTNRKRVGRVMKEMKSPGKWYIGTHGPSPLDMWKFEEVTGNETVDALAKFLELVKTDRNVQLQWLPDDYWTRGS